MNNVPIGMTIRLNPIFRAVKQLRLWTSRLLKRSSGMTNLPSERPGLRFPIAKGGKPPAPNSSNLSQVDVRLLPTASNPLQQRTESRAIYDDVLAVGRRQGWYGLVQSEDCSGDGRTSPAMPATTG
jgi:hypothetical protein